MKYKIAEIKNKILQGDTLTELKKFPDNSVDTIITSPPYNKGYYSTKKGHLTDTWRQRNIQYGNFKDNLNPQEYIKQQREILKESVRIVKSRGSIFYNHKSVMAGNKIVFPSYVFDFCVRQMIIWDRGSTPQIAPIIFYPITEYIFWITKTNTQPKFKRQGLKHQKEIWTINFKSNTEHPAPFPENLVSNCILATTNENDLILDYYMGSGTTAVVAKRLGRNYIGIELNKEYIKMSLKRLSFE